MLTNEAGGHAKLDDTAAPILAIGRAITAPMVGRFDSQTTANPVMDL
jgi:hypothetical protein